MGQLLVYIYIYIYIYPSCEQDCAVLAEMFDNVKGADRNKSPPPTRPCVQTIGSQIEQMESLSYKIWKIIDFYVVWKQDHPPKATKRVQHEQGDFQPNLIRTKL